VTGAPIVRKLTRREDGYPQTGRGTIDAAGRWAVQMDPAPQVLVNPDGPAAAALITELVEALEAFTDAWDNVDEPFQPQMPRLTKAAKAAIAKARGQQ
jgi:hypothetical protein